MKKEGLRYEGMRPLTEIDFTLMMRARQGDGFWPRRELVTGAIGGEHIEENS